MRSDGWVFGQVGGLYRTHRRRGELDVGRAASRRSTWMSAAPRSSIRATARSWRGSSRRPGRSSSPRPTGGRPGPAAPSPGPAWATSGAVEMFDAQRWLVLMASRLTPAGPTFDQTSDGGRTWRPLVLPRPAAVPAERGGGRPAVGRPAGADAERDDGRDLAGLRPTRPASARAGSPSSSRTTPGARWQPGRPDRARRHGRHPRDGRLAGVLAHRRCGHRRPTVARPGPRTVTSGLRDPGALARVPDGRRPTAGPGSVSRRSCARGLTAAVRTASRRPRTPA